MSYCKEYETIRFIRGYPISQKLYYCDWNGQYYRTYPLCYQSCLTYDYNGDGIAEPIPISQADWTLLLAFAGAICGLLLGYAIIGASN